MEIAPGIHRIACPFGDRVVYCHLILGDDRAVLVDTGTASAPDSSLFPYMEEIGLSPSDLDLVFITHSDFDHQGGNDIVRRAAPNALFAAHRLDAPWIESAQALIQGRYSQFEARHGIGYGDAGKAGIAQDCLSETPMDWHLQGGERYRVGPGYISFIHTPGHTWGHTAVLDERSGTLIAGEAALHTSILGLDGKPAMPPTYCYIATYQATLARLAGLPIETYSPAHWPVQRGADVRTFLADSLSYCCETEARLLDTLRRSDHPMTLREIIREMNESLGVRPRSAAQDLAYPLAGHLTWLVERGLVTETRASDGLSAYSAAANGRS